MMKAGVRVLVEVKKIKMEDALESLIDYRGKTPKKSEAGIPTLSAKSVRNSFIDYSDCYYISKEEYDRFMVRGFPRVGDILLTTEAPLGMVAKLDRDDVGIAQRLLTIRGKEGVLDTEFLMYYLQSPYGQQQLKERETGSTVSGIKQAEFRKIEVSIPDIATQKTIAKVFASIDEKVSLNRNINIAIQELAMLIFKKWFLSDAAECTEGTFSDIIDSTLGGDWGKETAIGNYTEQVYCIRGADIPEVKNGNKGKMPTRYILPKNFRQKQLVAGDIVVEISGGSPTQSTGRAAVINQSLLDRYDKGMVCTNFCRALKPHRGFSMFAYYYWQYLYENGVFFAYENGTTGIKNLDINSVMNNIKIQIPNEDRAMEFEDLCNDLFRMVFANGSESESLEEAKLLLLPKLITADYKYIADLMEG